MYHSYADLLIINCYQYIPVIIILYNSLIRREALYNWKKRNGSSATYRKLIKIFERADYRKYADEVRRIINISDSEVDTDSSGGEQPQVEQPQTYPQAQKPQALSQIPPEIPKPTKAYIMVNSKENLPKGKGRF